MSNAKIQLKLIQERDALAEENRILKAKMAIAIERFEYLERVWDDGDAREWAADVLKELSDMDDTAELEKEMKDV